MSLFVDIKKMFPDFELTVQLEGGREVLALLGGSGCGKSLTLKCIAGIEKPDKGQIVINGETVFDSNRRIDFTPQKRNVGYLFQNYALFSNMTVWNNISCVIKKPKAERSQTVSDIIKAFELENVKNLYPRQISGGQQQRTALARIIVSSPKVLMLDEPFSALDSHLKWNMEQEITSVLDNFEGTTIFVSHDRNEAYRISDKIAVMNNGKIELLGEKEEIFRVPKTLSAAMITGCKSISKAQKQSDYLIKALDWGVNLQTDRLVPDNIKYVGVHAHHFEIVQNDIGDNNFQCRIHRVLEEPFEKTIMFSFDSAGDSARLFFEIPKDKWSDSVTDEFFLHVPKDKIMYLL